MELTTNSAALQLRAAQKGNTFKRPTRPLISATAVDQIALKTICPANAIGVNPVRIDLGKCIFCDACALAFPSKIKFSEDPDLSTNVRDRLIVIEGEDTRVAPDPSLIRENRIDSKLSINLTIVGRNNGSDFPLTNKQSGIRLEKSAEKSHGLIFTEEITEPMEEVIARLYETILPPKLIILAGAKAISSGILNSKSFMDKYPVDLYIPGDFVHPEVLADAVNDLISFFNR
jgi:hypothetical protein